MSKKIFLGMVVLTLIVLTGCAGNTNQQVSQPPALAEEEVEAGADICEIDSDCVVFGQDGDCNCGCFNKNHDWQAEGECFCAAPIACKCVEGKCEEIFEEEQTVTYVDLKPRQAKDLIDTRPELIVVDVSPHYAKGHLPGAVHYYLGDGSLDKAIPTLDKEKPYLVYCHVDSVAIQGAEKLIDAGFSEVYRLEGNYGAWVDAGYPVEF